MIKLDAFTDAESLESLSAPNGTELCYSAKNGDEAIGAVFFAREKMDDGTALRLIGGKLLQGGDVGILDGLIRAGLFYGMERGIAFYFIPNELDMLCGYSLCKLGLKIGVIAEMESFFAAECCGHCN